MLWLANCVEFEADSTGLDAVLGNTVVPVRRWIRPDRDAATVVAWKDSQVD